MTDDGAGPPHHYVGVVGTAGGVRVQGNGSAELENVAVEDRDDEA
jgi:hypothetical protein